MNQRRTAAASRITEWPENARYAAYYPDTGDLEFYRYLPHPEMATPRHWLSRKKWEKYRANQEVNS